MDGQTDRQTDIWTSRAAFAAEKKVMKSDGIWIVEVLYSLVWTLPNAKGNNHQYHFIIIIITDSDSNCHQ